MRIRSFAAVIIAVLVLNFAGLAGADDRRAGVKKAQVTRLVNLLPASDGVAVFDAKRFLNDALPKLLSANQTVLGEVMAKITEVESRTGIDLRKFDQIAVGVTSTQVSATNTDLEPVLIAGGDISSGALIAIARLASNGTYREETISGHTVYIFVPKDVASKTASKNPNSQVASAIDQVLSAVTKEFAVTALDKSTLAIGTLPRVRETLLGQTHVSAELIGMLSQKETAVMSFALRTPDGMAKLVSMDNDDLGKSIDSIQLLSGSVEVATIGTTLHVAARTRQASQAQDLKDTLDGLQMVGKAVFGSSKRPDQQLYGRLIKNLKLDLHGSDISLDLLIPQADIDALVAKLK